MIRLINIAKTYQSKKKQTVNALKNINLSFGEKGMTFILGPSGSGKSTLMNLLGGIDAATSGEMIIDGHSFLDAVESTYDHYRNNYVGFIFQDFNLIQDITIFDNLALACFSDANNSVVAKIKAVLAIIGLTGYETRYPNELSGGQVQRIAIARALLKDSKVLLADEPTGNLNSEASMAVFKILQTISKEKLVIVVSHNEKLAAEFSDRIICIEDGRIVSDSLPEPPPRECDTSPYDATKKTTLSTRISLKMGLHNLFQKKLRFAINLLVLIIAFMTIMTTFVFVDYDRPYVDANNVASLNEAYISIICPPHHIVKTSAIQDVLEAGSLKYILNSQVEGYQDLIEMGFTMYSGSVDLSVDGVYVSDIMLQNIIDNGNVLLDLESKTVLPKAQYSFSDLVGMYIHEYILSRDCFYKICGVYHPDLDQTDNSLLDGTVEFDRALFFGTIYSPYFFSKEGEYVQDHKNKNPSFSSDSTDQYSFTASFSSNTTPSILLQNTVVIPSSLADFWVLLGEDDIIYDPVYDDDVFEFSDDNGVYLGIQLYNQLFNESSQGSYYIDNVVYNPDNGIYSREVHHFPTHIGEIVSFKVIDNQSGDVIEIKDVTVKGIILDAFVAQNSEGNPESRVLFSTDVANRLYEFTRNNFIIIQTASIENQYDFFRQIRKQNIFPQYTFTPRIEDFEYSLETVRRIFFLLTIFMSMVIVLTNIVSTTQSIKNREKENGILRAIGVRKKDVGKIFLFQILTMSLIAFVMIAIFSILMVIWVDNMLTHTYSPNFGVLYFRWRYLALIFAFVFGINFVSSGLALIPAIQRKPIDLIRGL